MAVLLLALVTIGGFAWYVLTPAERARIRTPLVAAARRVKHLVLLSHAELGPFRAALHARTRMPLAVPALAAAGVVVFALMAAGSALDDPDTLIAWGASFGPRTTNGEWWRLVAMLSVHASVLHLVVNTAALVQAGLLVERLVGTAAFATVYVAAGLAAGLVDLAVSPVGVSAGASGAIAGVYGLLIVAFGWSHLSRSDVAIPWRALVLLAPLAAIFAAYNLNTGMVGRQAEIAGFATGLGLGLALAAGVSERKPPLKRSAVALAASVIVVAGLALPMRGMTDPRHALEEVLAMEDRTAAIYARAVQQFRAGRVPAVALADLIEGTILPEVHAAAAPLASLARVPRDYQELVRHAEEYVRLRGDSWHLRAAALRSASMPRLREADQVERASLEALDRARPIATGG